MPANILDLEQELADLLEQRVSSIAHSKELPEAGHKWSKAIWHAAQQSDRMNLTQHQIEQAFAFSQRPIFICGSERSGTTLLRNLLDGHHQLSVLPAEGTFYTNSENKLMQVPVTERKEHLCREWLWRLVTSMHVPPYWLLGRSSPEHSAYLDFARAFILWWDIMERKLSTENASWPFIVVQLAYVTAMKKLDPLHQLSWAEKTPYNELHLKRILQDFPKAKIIQTVRHPIDVINSHKPAEGVSDVPIHASTRKLCHSFSIANKQVSRNSPHYKVLTYEALTEHTTATMKSLAAFLGIEYTDILTTSTVAGLSARANSSFKQDATDGTVISKKKRRQQLLLTKKELTAISAYLYPLALKFGYQLPPIGILQKQYIKAGFFARRAIEKIARSFVTKHPNA